MGSGPSRNSLPTYLVQHTEGKNSMEIYAPDNLYLVFKTAEFSIQPGYYEKIQDVIDALYKAGLSNLTDVVLSYDDTSKRVTVKCGRRAVVKLRGDIARMFGFLNDTTIRASDKKGFTLALPGTGNQYFYIYTDIIRRQYHGDVVVPVLRTGRRENMEVMSARTLKDHIMFL